MADPVAVYVGAGLDVRPLRVLADVRRFVYVDSRPKTEARIDENANKKMFYQYAFVDDVLRAMSGEGFYLHPDDFGVLLAHAPRPADLDLRARRPGWRERLCFGAPRVQEDWPPTEPFVARFVSRHPERTVYYHFNTLFPEDVSGTLKRQIYAAETLVMAGFRPHKSIARMLKPPFRLVLLEGTYYGPSEDPDDEETLAAEMHRDGFGPRVKQCVHYHKEYVGEYCVSLVHAESVRQSGGCRARIEG